MNQFSRKTREYLTGTTNSAGYVSTILELIPVRPPEPVNLRRDSPSSETAKAIKDTLAGKDVIRCESADEMFQKLGI
jgi:antitoxin component of RelBE/YafQ-DinJ toxin-antitoxin module